MNPDEFPSIPEDLINELERRFPNAVPRTPHITLSEINRLQGIQEVIFFLRVTYEKQQRVVAQDSV